MQRASNLYNLALLYERLNQAGTAAKVFGNVQMLCPGSRLACQAQNHCAEMRTRNFADVVYSISGQDCGLQQVGISPEQNDPDARMKELMNQAATLREMQRQWEAIWFPNMLSHSGHSGAEESDVHVQHTKLDLILSGYHQACRSGNVDRARQLAIEARDRPNVFAK